MMGLRASFGVSLMAFPNNDTNGGNLVGAHRF